MKMMKILWMALGLCLSGGAVLAADTDRFFGGSYDGWDRNAMAGFVKLAPNNDDPAKEWVS